MNKNIVLIGLAGSGKTTLGKALSIILNRKLIDIDKYIEETQGKTISEIFENGESHFREIESAAVLVVSQNTNSIISTGGGVIKSEANMVTLKKNGIVIYIDRPIERILSDLDDSNRPLLKNNKSNLYKLHEARHPLYKKYSDIVVINDASEEEVVNKILEILEQLQ